MLRSCTAFVLHWKHCAVACLFKLGIGARANLGPCLAYKHEVGLQHSAGISLPLMLLVHADRVDAETGAAGVMPAHALMCQSLRRRQGSTNVAHQLVLAICWKQCYKENVTSCTTFVTVY